MKIIATIISAAFAIFAFAFSGFLPMAQAVTPAPDGGYPNGNTAEGTKALFSLTTGGYNTGNGWNSLHTLTTGSFNTGVGAGTLLANTADENTATGTGALLTNTTGGLNTANGAFALLNNTEGSSNTAIGDRALQSNTTGGNNTADGVSALAANTTGDDNTAIGVVCLFNNTTGTSNTATGYQTLYHNTTGNQNTAAGMNALLMNTEGQGNTATGFQALLSNTTGNGNTAIGVSALQNNTTGGVNIAIGPSALGSNTEGTGNIALGFRAGLNLTTGDSNIDIGSFGVPDESNTIRIGGNLQTSTFVAGIAGQTVGAGGTTCYVDNDGKLGVFLSARRFKTDIADMGAASEALLALRPVTFHYKPELDKTGIPQFGLVAEEVAKVNPDLVTHDAKGDISTVRYDAVNVMLLNEFLKEHKKVREQQATITELKSTVAKQETGIAQQRKDFEATITEVKKGMETLALRSKQQDVKIQKVSDRIELSKSAPQMVNSQ